MSLMGAPLYRVSLCQNDIFGNVVPNGIPKPPLAPFRKAEIFNILDENRFSEV